MDARARRVRHGEAFWREHIFACERAGCGVKAYALEHGLGEQNFYKWRKRLLQSGPMPGQESTPMFRRLEVVQVAVPPNENRLSNPKDVLGSISSASETAIVTVSNCRIQLPNGSALEVNGALSSGLIGQLLQMAGSFPMVSGRSMP